MSRPLATCLVLLAGLLGLAPGAQAQEPVAPPPANDTLPGATPLPLATVLRGSTTGSTFEPNEPAPVCSPGAPGGSVWYALPTTSKARDLVVEVNAGGDLDAVVDIVSRERSQLSPGECAPTDKRGRATLDFTQEADTQLYVRVSPLANSAPGPFTLRAVAPDAPEGPPGRPLPPKGATGAVDRVANPDDAYGVSLKAGRTYRLRLVSRRGCVNATLFGPDVPSFDDGGVRSLSCNGYVLFTPGAGEGGRYALQVTAPRTRRGSLPYRLLVQRAGPDDTAPGVRLPNDRRRSGALEGSRTDVVDLYRFPVLRRSVLDLRLNASESASFDLRLVSAGGKRIACACGGSGAQRLRRKVKPGRYFVAVRSRGATDGRYTLRRLARTITRLRLGVPGRVGEGSAVPVTATVAPGASGPVTFRLERFDPLAGWQFKLQERRRAVGGRATLTLRPPGVGRWRVRATFEGTRRFAPAQERTARFLVEERTAAGD